MADVGGWFELFFVNVMGLPFQSGLIVFLGLVLFLLIGAIYRFRKRIVNTGLWCLLMLTIGYTTYAVILIRANANTPLNENAPDTIFTLKSYLNREQYESAPLLYGRTYASEPEYVPEGDYYKVKTEKVVPSIDRIRKKASIKLFAIRKTCATLKICCFRECGMIVRPLLTKDGPVEVRMRLLHKKRT